MPPWIIDSGPLDSYLISPTEAKQLWGTRGTDASPHRWLLPQGRHVLLVACRDMQTAKEYQWPDQAHGVFSHILMETLQQASGRLTYQDLFKRTHALIRARILDQSPQMEATHLEDLDQPFLGGAIAARPPHFTVSHRADSGWVMDGGAIHGVQPPTLDGETTQLALFPFDSPPDQLQKLSQALAKAVVTVVLPQLSQLRITTGEDDLNPDTTFKAVVTHLPLPRLRVVLAGEADALDQLRQALQQVGFEARPSLYVREVDASQVADFRVLARDGAYLITRPADDHASVAPLSGYTQTSAAQVVQRLEVLSQEI